MAPPKQRASDKRTGGDKAQWVQGGFKVGLMGFEAGRRVVFVGCFDDFLLGQGSDLAVKATAKKKYMHQFPGLLPPPPWYSPLPR